MNEVINAVNQVDGSIETVNARELHSYLGSKVQFSNWITKKIADYGFVEGVDYVKYCLPAGVKMVGNIRRVEDIEVSVKNLALESMGYSSFGQQGRIEYGVSLNMAKELGMIDGGEKGKEIRKWFIAREKKATQLETTGYKLPTSFREALLLAAQQEEKLEQQNLQLTEQAPKVDFYNKVADASNSYTMSRAANILGGGRNTLIKVLKEQGYLQPDKVPYAQYGINGAGYFTCKSRFVDNTNEMSYTTSITGKGMQYLQKKIASGNLRIGKD